MPVKTFFAMLNHAEDYRDKQMNRFLFEMCDIMTIANTIPEHKEQLQKVYQKRVLGPEWRDPAARVFDSDNKHAIAWMNNVFNQATKLMGKK